jgi:hypothetical protein
MYAYGGDYSQCSAVCHKYILYLYLYLRVVALPWLAGLQYRNKHVALFFGRIAYSWARSNT